MIKKLWPKIVCCPKFLNWLKNFDSNYFFDQIFLTQILHWPKNFDPKLFAYPNFCNDPKTLTQNFTLTQIFDPKFCNDPNFCNDPTTLTQKFTLTQIFWPKINGDPKFYKDLKILNLSFFGLWPGFFGSAGPKNFNSVLEDKISSPCPRPRRSSPWPGTLQVLKNALSSARGQHYALTGWKWAKVMGNVVSTWCTSKNLRKKNSTLEFCGKFANLWAKIFSFFLVAWFLRKIFQKF